MSTTNYVLVTRLVTKLVLLQCTHAKMSAPAELQLARQGSIGKQWLSSRQPLNAWWSEVGG